MRLVTANPWVMSPTGEVVDVHGEWIGTGKLDPRFESWLFDHYHTHDKREILRRLNKDDDIPIWDAAKQQVLVVHRDALKLAVAHALKGCIQHG